MTALGRAVRQLRQAFAELRARVELARTAYADARKEGLDRIGAGLAALRATVSKQEQHEQGEDAHDGRDSLKARLDQIMGREADERAQRAQNMARAREEARCMRDRLRGALGKDGPGR